MRRFVLALAFVALSVSAAAQEVVSVRFYIVPKAGTGVDPDFFRPKYVHPDELIAGQSIPRWQAMDYGVENVFLLGADVTPELHTALAAQADVLAVPAPLDTQVSAVALSRVQSALESVNLPGSWVTTSHTYRQVLRTVAKIILLLQRYNGLHGAVRLFESGVTLDTRWNQLTSAQQDRLIAMADSMGVDRSGLTNTTTIRQILRALAEQLPPLTLRGESL